MKWLVITAHYSIPFDMISSKDTNSTAQPYVQIICFVPERVLTTLASYERIHEKLQYFSTPPFDVAPFADYN